MASKKSNPPGATGGLGNRHQLAAVDAPENKPSQIELQGFGARFIARRHRLAPAMARAVAELAFSEVAR